MWIFGRKGPSGYSACSTGNLLLTNLLLEVTKSTARESCIEGRIVNLSSEAHRFAHKEGIRFYKINKKSSCGPWYAYGESKFANILHANELTKRFKEEGVYITANSVYPGAIGTNLFRHRSFIEHLIAPIANYLIKNVQQGAATTCYVALHPQVKGVSGEYFADSNVAKTTSLGKDEKLAKDLWNFSLSLTEFK